jgi:hypothetical protein
MLAGGAQIGSTDDGDAALLILGIDDKVRPLIGADDGDTTAT